MMKRTMVFLILFIATLTVFSVKITVTAPYAEMLSFLQEKAVEFTGKNPQVEVEVIQEPEGGQIAALIAAGNAPDLFIGVFGYMPEKYASMGKLVNLSQLEGFDEMQSRIYNGIHYSDDGGVYFIPWMLTTQMLIYNADLFKEAGLDPDKAPETFDQFIEYARKISQLPNREDGSKVYGTVFWNDALVWGGWYWTMLSQIYYNFNNGEYGLFDDFGLDVVFDDENAHMKEFLEFCKNAQEFAPMNMEKNFFSRSIGMWLQYGYSWKPNLMNAKDEPMEIGKDVRVAPIPVNKTGWNHWSTLDGRSLMIFKSNREKENASWEFIKFLMEDDNNLQACEVLGYLPSLVSLKQHEYFSSPENAPFVAQLENALPNEAVAQLDEISNLLLSVYAETVVKKSMDISQGIDAAAEEARNLLSGK